jgi:4-oxalomesaconate tautomerase
MNNGTPVMWMRSGTSKGAYFLSKDVPSDVTGFLLAIMGSPHPMQIDGIGGGDPLTSKVAIVSPSVRDDADVDYHFYQVFVDEARVSDAQGCGNILAGVGPFAIERGLVDITGDETRMRIHMVNTGEIAVAIVQTPNGAVTYSGDARIDGVPGTAAPIRLMFDALAGSMCGALLPTGNAVDVIDGVRCTLIDNGMPCVIMAATDLGATGCEDRDILDGLDNLKSRIEDIRRHAGHLMNLGDVTEKSVPKMFLVSAPQNGGVINTRSFIPKRAHASIGVFAAITVASATTLPEGPARDLANPPNGISYAIEHPSGIADVVLDITNGTIHRAGTVRTARKLIDGAVFPNGF